jgi:predicted ArsR family transcriptional regulator
LKKKPYFSPDAITSPHQATGGNMEAKQVVLDVLKKEGKPMSAGQIAEISGLDRKEVDKAMKALKDEDRIVSPKRCFWQARL